MSTDGYALQPAAVVRVTVAGWQAMEDETMPRHQALENVTRTLERGLLA